MKEEDEESTKTPEETEIKETTEKAIEETEGEAEKESVEEKPDEILEEAGAKEEGISEEKAEETVEAEEEVKPEKEEKREEEEEIVEERIYTIPLGRAWISTPRKRAPRAIRIIKGFVTKHMKLEKRKEEEEEEEPRKLVIDNAVNEMVWSRGIEKPPRKIRIRAAKDKEGNVTVYLAEGD